MDEHDFTLDMLTLENNNLHKKNATHQQRNPLKLKNANDLLRAKTIFKRGKTRGLLKQKKKLKIGKRKEGKAIYF